MKLLSAAAVLATTIAATFATAADDNNTTCVINTNNNTYTLQYLPTGAQSVPLDNSNSSVISFSMSACTASSDLGSSCGAGYIGITDGSDKCVATFDTITSFTANSFYVEREFAIAADKNANTTNVLTLRAYCDADASDDDDAPITTNSSVPSTITTVGSVTTYKIQFYSKSVCADFTPADGDNGSALKTGAIVGIVIGVVGVVVLASVIYQWRSKAKEEANLQYTQLNQ